MANRKKNIVLKGAIATATVATVVLPSGGVKAATVYSGSQIDSTNDKVKNNSEESISSESASNTNQESSKVSYDDQIIPINEENFNDTQIGSGTNTSGTGETDITDNVTNTNNSTTNNTTNDNTNNSTWGTTDNNTNGTGGIMNSPIINNSNSGSVTLNSIKPEVPYFYYWTSGTNVFLSWDYGETVNRPTKIEAVMSTDPTFSNSDYIQVKITGAEFVPTTDSDFYVRVRFYDSSGNVTHESIRKVIRNNSSETREIKGLAQSTSGNGLKVSWNTFTTGIASGQIYVNGKFVRTLTSAEASSNSFVIDRVSAGDEVLVKIINGSGLEYNGVVFVQKGTVQPTVMSLSTSKDGTGINVNLANTSFVKGDKFGVKVTQKFDNAVIVANGSYTLDRDKGSFVIYPDSGKTLLATDYTVEITDLTSGEKYTYDYSHTVNQNSNFTSIATADGQVLSSWIPTEGTAMSSVIWSTSPDFANYNTIEVPAGKTGVTFNSGLTSGQTVYLLLTNYDKDGRVISETYDQVVIGKTSGQLKNLKGFYKSDTVAEFTWDKIGTTVTKGIIKVNDTIMMLTPAQIETLNSTNSFSIGGFNRGSQYKVDLYLVDANSNVYSGSVSSISNQSSSVEQGDVTFEGPSGISAVYTINPGVLTLLLDSGMYDIAQNSQIGVAINGETVPGVSAKYISQSNGISITGLIPTKQYTTISLTYTDSKGETKSVSLSSLTIKLGSTLDSFLVNAYNKAVSRDTQNIDEAGYKYWKDGLVSKELSLTYFIRNLAFVPEFMNLINSPQDLVTRLYQVLVLRSPEPQGLQFWTLVYNDLIANGVSHNEAISKIIVDMTTNTEFLNLAERLGVNP